MLTLVHFWYAIATLLLTYFVYTRFISVMIMHRYYEKQGALQVPGALPFFGNIKTIISLVEEAKSKQLTILFSEAIVRAFS